MITRYIFTGYYTEKKMIPKENSEIEFLSFFTYEDKVFMYFESENPDVNPDDVATENLKEFPDGRHWMRMGEIFHFSKPVSVEQWKRKKENKTPNMRIMYLRDDKIASYVFYHYRYQEEIAGDWDKYSCIFLLGNMLAFYAERPVELDFDAVGSFKTCETPYLRWGEIMNEHFRKWENEERTLWRSMERI